MQIAALTQHGVGGWPTLKWGPFSAGLNAVYGPPRSGKTALAGLLAHTLFGRAPSLAGAERFDTPPGEVFVESDAGRHRVRLYRDDHKVPRLTVAAMDGSAVDANTIGRLMGGLTRAVLAPLCAINFCESPDVAALLSAEFARGYQAVAGGGPTRGGRRTAELAARRDLLAQELETRIAGERQASKDLENRCRELDRQLRSEQERIESFERGRLATETALAETDARLRYRRLELRLDQQPGTLKTEQQNPTGGSDEHETRIRATLAVLAQREASVRAHLAQIEVAPRGEGGALAETRRWLAVNRQLAADLAGEVARLARATASAQCVCRDAHPRLRPISETIERQLDVLEKLVEAQQRAAAATELSTEIDQLERSQAELKRHLGALLERRHSQACIEASQRGPASFSAADAEQLEARRLELEQQRFQLNDELRAHARQLRDLRASRETVERQRAALLSARSIEHVQRELASVQQKLEQSASVCGNAGDVAIAEDSPARASDFLAQLTDGGFLRLTLVEQGRRACVVNRHGQTLRVESLAAAERDLVYLSLCLSLLSAAQRRGIRLPLVLDEPFERLDGRQTAAMAAVLDDFCRQGHQVIVFTSKRSAVERLAAVGGAVHEIFSLRQRASDHAAAAVPAPARQDALPETGVVRKRKSAKRRTAKTQTKRVNSPPEARGADRPPSEQSDAA